MSVVSLNSASLAESGITAESLKALASKAGLVIPEKKVDDFKILLAGVDHAAKSVLASEDYFPKVDLDLYPRTDYHIPKDTDKGGWASKVTVKSTKPLSSELAGRTIAIKDNIGLAGIPCTNGTLAVSWTPQIDATVVTRMLDAAGLISGKAACENACFEGISDSSATGMVHNPYCDGYSAGGSSSGSGRLVASGRVDMALGCDQGGSIRIPASSCGIVGLKPTWGLVPYTGIISLEATIDHVGPMTATVRDNALLMDVLAGCDGIDDRQPYNLMPGSIDFVQGIDELLALSTPLAGVRVGVLKEGFECEVQDPNVTKLVLSAVEGLKALGVTVEDVSMPSHKDAAVLWMTNLQIAGTRQGLLSDATGRKGLCLTDRVEATGRRLSQRAFDSFSSAAQNVYLQGLFLEERYGPVLHAKSQNLLRKINDEYDQLLKTFDVLIMPTLPAIPGPISEVGDAGPLERLSRSFGMTYNTAPFNSTGHPALSVPVGFAPAKDDEKIMLPVGMQIVGRKFEDLMCLKVAAAWEKANDWKKV